MQNAVLPLETAQGRVSQYATRVVERAIDLLFCLSRSDEPLGVTQLAGQLELSKATVFRLLQTLAGRGLVSRNAHEGTYALTPRVLTLGVRFLPFALPIIARPFLEELRAISQETATLGMRVGDERVFLAVLPSPLEVRMVPEVGRAVPLVHGASGKVLLAFAEAELRERLIQAAFREQGRKGIANYEAQLAEIRRQGFAHSVQERTLGAASIAAAVRDRTGMVTATIALSAPVARFDGDVVKRLTPRVVDVATRLSWELGCPEAPLTSGRR